MDLSEKIEREINRAETLKTHYDNIYGGTFGSITIGRAIAHARAAIDTDSKLAMADSLKELQALE